ncbi:hypothetical protein [Brevibacillus laterosporus]|uniref:Uncharacterized protein n=1 Tax=Brevibacillus laterosporus TaxID=1465 RepID=A0AAP8QH06_BRELA|nr:hypothetical protein [Brevibacillus laterosporus]PPB12948.1 hypothetical protein C4A77_00750 [Brevibacillus laterosporus]
MTKYVVRFYYGEEKSIVEFLDEKKAEEFYEDMKKGCDKVYLVKVEPLRQLIKEADITFKENLLTKV